MDTEQSAQDQPNYEESIQDQPLSESNDDQVLDSTDAYEQPLEDSVSTEEPVVEIDGQQVPVSELKAGYLRNKDYTYKTKQLAEEKKRLSEIQQFSQIPDLDPQAKAAMKLLKQYGFTTKEDLAEQQRIQQAQADGNAKFQRIINANPELKKQEKVIRDLGNLPQNSNKAWEDIVHEYGFKPKTALERAKRSGELTGTPPSLKKSSGRSVKDMSSDEYEAWRSRNLTGSAFTRLSK